MNNDLKNKQYTNLDQHQGSESTVQEEAIDHPSPKEEDHNTKIKNDSQKQQNSKAKKEGRSITDKISEALETFADVLDQMASRHEIKTFTIEAILERLEPSIDREMKEIATQQDLTPLGGELIFTKEGAVAGRFMIDIKLYFLDQEGNYILRNKIISPQLMVFTKEAKADFMQNAPITYPIEVPEL